ncbi:MAG: hypothetical protein U1F43_10595 [Myxococcota bacterium]
MGVVDAGAHVVDADGKTLGRSAAYAGRALHWALHLGCPIVHPAVMLRRALLPPGGYPATDTRMEDYALWLDLLPRVRFEHLAEPLIVYRRHAQAVGASRGRRLEGPRAWAERVGPRVGMAPGELTAEVARAWLNPRCVRMDAERTDPAALAELARRLDPRALALGAHVPAWKPAALARCQRVYARRALALLWHGRGDRRLVRHVGPVAAAATASALAGLGGPRPA